MVAFGSLRATCILESAVGAGVLTVVDYEQPVPNPGFGTNTAELLSMLQDRWKTGTAMCQLFFDNHRKQMWGQTSRRGSDTFEYRQDRCL